MRTMANRKMNARYYFTVEGETEKWYLEWLRDAINADPRAKVKIVWGPAPHRPSAIVFLAG